MQCKTSCPLYPRKRTCAAQLGMSALGKADSSVPSRFCDAAVPADCWKIIGRSYIQGSRARPPGAGSHSDDLFRAGGRARPLTRPFTMVGRMPHRRRRVFVDTPKGRRSAGFTVPENADAADVSMALRRRGWSPFALRLDSEQHAWFALVMDWQRAA